jgi:hypothetical protein
MTFALYVLGFVVLIAGVAWGLSEAGVGTTYIAIASLILLGLGIFTGAARTRSKDPPTT